MSHVPNPNSPSVTEHHGFSCGNCGEQPIRGVRYKCVNCYDYDLVWISFFLATSKPQCNLCKWMECVNHTMNI